MSEIDRTESSSKPEESASSSTEQRGAAPSAPEQERFEQQLNAPSGADEAASSAGATRRHTVQPGDTMSHIAQRHGVALDDVIAANPQIHNPSLIVPGEQINLPGPPLGSTPQTTAAPTDPGFFHPDLAANTVPTDTGPVPSEGLAPGDAVQVQGTGAAGLNLRASPSIEGTDIGGFPEGTALQVATPPDGGPAQQGDWVYVADDRGQEGWVHGDFLAQNAQDPQDAEPASSPAGTGGTASTASTASTESTAPANPSVGGGLPDTTGMSEAERYDVYADYINEHGNEQAQQALANGDRVILGLRNDTDMDANGGNGRYDDRIVVLWRDDAGNPQVEEFDANTEPNRWNEENTQWGADIDGDGDREMGRLREGTMEYRMSSWNGGEPALRPVDGSQNGVVYDADDDGLYDAGDVAATDNDTLGRDVDFNSSFLFHAGYNDNITGSAGCQTLPPSVYDDFIASLGDQGNFQYVLVNVTPE